MPFLEPSRPEGLPTEKALLIRRGRFCDIRPTLCAASIQLAAIEYLSAMVSAIPIPKALVFSPFKDKLNSPLYRKALRNGLDSVMKELMVATIIVWLWSNHEQPFQKAFKINGRIDVDPDCKWLIQAAVDQAVDALSLEINHQVATGSGPFVDVFAAKKDATSVATESSASDNIRRAQVCTATTVSKSLVEKMFLSDRLNEAIPQFQNLVDYLDELRACALLVKAQERVMLANLVARKTTMNESFACAYTSSMIRAGEVLGQDKLFEAVQDAKSSTCSMLPHDILTGEGNAWEDPCKPDEGFSIRLTGTDLMRRAHARATIHKSMKKLQDRNHVRGGVPDFGPYVDPSVAASVPTAQVKFEGNASPRFDSKKRRPSIGDLMMQPGTGSAQARAWSLYEPRHTCDQVDWRPNLVENTPYGLHRRGEIVRSLSVSLSSRSGEPRSMKKSKRALSAAVSSPLVVSQAIAPSANGEDMLPRSTQEINWAEVAGIFQKVEVPKKVRDDPALPARAILAPCYRQVDLIELQDGESDTEEDLDDEIVLAKHEVVLERMKQKIDDYLSKQKEQQQDRRRKNASQKQGSK
jgi:hypothetical protein